MTKYSLTELFRYLNHKDTIVLTPDIRASIVEKLEELVLLQEEAKK